MDHPRPILSTSITLVCRRHQRPLEPAGSAPIIYPERYRGQVNGCWSFDPDALSCPAAQVHPDHPQSCVPSWEVRL